MKIAKIGRPPVSKKLEKASLLSVRFTADERKALEAAAGRGGLRLSEWARRVLIAAASAVDDEP
jgi:hypothetical protein